MKTLRKAFPVVTIVCGIVITACKVYALATDTLKMPSLLFLGPFMLIGGIVQLALDRRHQNQLK